MTSNHTGQLYKLSYEAFAQFSSSLTQARNLEQVMDCLEKKVKYLFDYNSLRISFRYDNYWVHLKTGRGIKEFLTTQKPGLFSYEKQLISRPIPQVWEVSEKCDVSKDLEVDFDKDKQIWAWHFKANELKDLTIALVSGHSQNFGVKSIPFLKLFVEILEGKLMEIVLFEQLKIKNKRIELSLATIEEKNVEIQAIMEHQDDVIKKQTADLKERNNQLVKISVLNAHNVREPLSRIMGLTGLLDQNDCISENSEILEMIKQSASDLDGALQEVITMAVNDVTKYKA